MKIRILLVWIILLFALDFVPVKFAQKDTDIMIDNKKYIFCYEPKTLGTDNINWVAYGYSDNKINDDIEPLQVLVEEGEFYNNFAERDFAPVKLYNAPQGSNKFVMRGDMKKIIFDDHKIGLTVAIKDWDIVYPIKRLSIRGSYVSKNYLTIYDYDWVYVMKNILGRFLALF